MALDFPSSPALGQTVTGPDGTVWSWDGAKWVPGIQSGAYAPLNSPVLTGNPQAPTPSPGDSDTSLATTAFVSAAVAPYANSTGRNLLHNALFNVSQRGPGPFAVVGYTLDRWINDFIGGTCSVSRVLLTDADRTAIGDEVAWAALQCVVAGGAALNNYSIISQYVEDIRRLAAKTVTVSFWAKAGSGTPKLGVSIDQGFGTGGGSPYVAGIGQAVTLSTTWTRYSRTFAVPSVNGKTIGTSNNDRSMPTFWLSAEASWNSGSGSIGVQSATILLWGIQLEIGSVATPLEKPEYPQEMLMCQRFYQIITISLSGNGGVGITYGYTVPTTTSMRAAPTLTSSGPVLTNANPINLSNGAVGNGVISWTSPIANGYTAYSTTVLASADL
jgi:hypothetical protein